MSGSGDAAEAERQPAPATGLSRRQLIAGASGGAGMLVVAGCASARHSSHRQPAAVSLDVRLLNRSLDLEYETIAAYTAGIPLLYGRQREAAKRFLDQELSHSGELAGLVKQAGGKPNRPRSSYDLGQPHGSQQILELLHMLETRQLTTYLHALPLLSVGATRAAIGAVLANEAQHLAILRMQSHGPALTAALPSGANQ